MAYARIENNHIVEYPVYEGDIKLRYPNTSFSIPFKPPAGYEPVADIPMPQTDDDHVVVEGDVELVDGVWTRTWVIEDAPAEVVAQRKRARADWRSFWDGLLVNAAFVHVQTIATQDLAVNLAYTNCSAQLLLARQGDLNIEALQACFDQLLGLLVDDIALGVDEKAALVELAATTKVDGLLMLNFAA